MKKSAELLGPSCLTHAADDEPLFVLRANDELAPDIVEEWARRYRFSKARAAGGMNQHNLKKYTEAIALAGEMRAWKKIKECPSAPEQTPKE